MGVHNLWELLAPVGRRVSVETLAGKKLAIDASIWMIQFIKAMRDEKGEMIRNAHLVGFFRRICKLLFLRVKPVFVFDGATPALKRRTVIARRRQRENAQTKIRKTAEKLLLNQLKAMRLKELQQKLLEQRQQNDLDPKMISSELSDNAKGKRVVDETIVTEAEKLSATTYNQEELDEILAASIAAEEDGNFASHASTSGTGVRFEDDEGDDGEGDDDEEMILPAMHGNVDPAVLAALPPSMQLDLLVQMRERLMAENRQRYQKVKKAPSRFSELQIQAYLKTVAFRREIDAVQKSAAGKGIGGMQTSRIASEANREFIFSSSFTGDKQVLASGGEEKTDTRPNETSRADVSSRAVIDSITRSNQTEECFTDATGIGLPNDVETYLDERGRIRVSRVRAMGIRMTRDLQRNLDLMKEIEHESVLSDKYVNNEPSNRSPVIPENLSSSIFSHNHKDGFTSLEISFETNEEQKSGDDEDIFARLVAGETLMNVSADISPSPMPTDCKDLSASDCEWEEGVIDGKSTVPSEQTIHELKPYLADNDVDDDSGIEWEDGCASISKEASPYPVECSESLSRDVSEEAEFQEAIRRSLVDRRVRGDSNVSCENLNPGEGGLRDYLGESSSMSKEDSMPETKIPVSASVLLCKSSSETHSEQMIDNQGNLTIPPDSDNIETQLIPHLPVNPVDLELSTGDARDRCLNSTQDKTNDLREKEEITDRLDTCDQAKDVLVQEQLGDIQSSKHGSSMGADGSSGVSCSTPLPGVFPSATPIDVSPLELKAKVDDHCHESLISGSTSFVDVENKSDFESKSFPEDHNSLYLEKEKSGGNSSFMDNITGQDLISEASLEEELLVLDKESRGLGNEQRRLERNAESVSSEMFAECQELLQMFGLPYIIAPMEAEAQCAFMELANLVDGVVTDDSDAFLFGARSVYKNIFDDRKYVETYFMKDIENELGLDRDKLIRMALLLGSDYTEGISGIGIVNAIEVVNAFPEEDGLRKFREWIESPDPSILGKLDVEEGCGTRKRGSKVRENEMNKRTSELEGNSDFDLNMLQTEDENQKLKQIFMEKHRNVSKNWHIPSTFPSDVVITAYASPQVDNSTDSFSWAKPDLLALHKVCWEKFGWNNKKADEILLPVLKEYDKHETQLRLEAFYTFNEKFAKIRSKRIKSALKGVRGNKSQDVMNDSDEEGVSKSKKRRKTNYVEAQKNVVEKESGLPEHGGGIVEKIPKMSKRKLSNRMNTRLEAVEGIDTRASDGATMSPIARNGSNDRRGNGRKNLSSGKRKKNKMDSCLENAGTDSDGEFDNETEEIAPEFERPLKVRRSERPRKAVNYAITNVDLGYRDVVEECCTTSSESDGLMNETSHNQVTGNSLYGPPPNDENTPENLLQESPEDLLESGGGFYGEAAEPNQVSFADIGNPVVEVHLLEKYLKTSGGFCLEDDSNTIDCPGKEAESSHANCGSDADPLAEDHISEEYLKSGGGFCLDGNEAADDNCANPSVSTHPSSSAIAEEEIRLSNPSQSCYASGENELSKGRLNGSDSENRSNRKTSVDLSLISSSNDIARENDGGTDTMRPLRPMPNLRRKRRQTQ